MNIAIRSTRNASPIKSDAPTLPSDVPSLHSISPEFKEARDHLAKLRALREKLVGERDALAAKFDGAQPPTFAGISAAVAAALGVPSRDTTDSDAAAKQLQQIEIDLSVVERALQAAQSDMREQAIIASRAACKAVAPQHRELALAVIGAAIELHRANAAYTAFTNTLNRKGIRWSRLGSAFPKFAGGPGDRNGPLASFLRGCMTDGLIERGDIPKELR
ncbi:MAG: hypothetical protein JSR61_02655 [Proteobacteria bacterium]|nr:hypothetical protein [Pseudomonadota bacterium]